MNGIKLGSGINNCEWNVEGRCTNYEITYNKKRPGFSRDWDSKQNCTCSIIGVHKCHRYVAQTR